jgi:hypothetical protein
VSFYEYLKTEERYEEMRKRRRRRRRNVCTHGKLRLDNLTLPGQTRLELFVSLTFPLNNKRKCIGNGIKISRGK